LVNLQSNRFISSDMMFFSICLQSKDNVEWLLELSSRLDSLCLVVLSRAETRIDSMNEKSCSDIVHSPKRAVSPVYLSSSIIRVTFATVLWIIRVSALSPDLASNNCCHYALVLKSIHNEHWLPRVYNRISIIERYTEIKVFGHNSLHFPAGIAHNHVSVGRYT